MQFFIDSLKKKLSMTTLSLKMNRSFYLVLKYLCYSIFHQIQCQFLIEEIVNKKSTLVWDSQHCEIFISSEKLPVKSVRILPGEDIKV